MTTGNSVDLLSQIEKSSRASEVSACSAKRLILNRAVASRRAGNLRPSLQPQLVGSSWLQACWRDQLPAVQIFPQRLAEDAIPALYCIQLLRFFSQPGKEPGDAQVGPPRRLLLAMRAAHRQRRPAGVLGFAGNRLEQQRPAGDDFTMLIRIGQPEKQAPPVVDQRHVGGQQAATSQILRCEATPAPVVLQLIKRVLAIRSVPVELA